MANLGLMISRRKQGHPVNLSAFSIAFLESRKGYLIVVQLLNHVWLFVTPWIAACQASLSFTISWSLFKLMSIESMVPSNHLLLCLPLLLLPSIFPSIKISSNESARRIRRPKYWSFSFSLLGMQERTSDIWQRGRHSDSQKFLRFALSIITLFAPYVFHLFILVCVRVCVCVCVCDFCIFSRSHDTLLTHKLTSHSKLCPPTSWCLWKAQNKPSSSSHDAFLWGSKEVTDVEGLWSIRHGEAQEYTRFHGAGSCGGWGQSWSQHHKGFKPQLFYLPAVI